MAKSKVKISKWVIFKGMVKSIVESDELNVFQKIGAIILTPIILAKYGFEIELTFSKKDEE